MSNPHWYFSQYQTPNIIIVPTEEPPCKKTKLDDDNQVTLLQNTENKNQHSFTNLITIPNTSEPLSSYSNSVNKNYGESKIVKTSWASNFLQSIGQVPEKTLSKKKNNILIENTSEKPDKKQEGKNTSINFKMSITEGSNISLNKVKEAMSQNVHSDNINEHFASEFVIESNEGTCKTEVKGKYSSCSHKRESKICSSSSRKKYSPYTKIYDKHGPKNIEHNRSIADGREKIKCFGSEKRNDDHKNRHIKPENIEKKIDKDICVSKSSEYTSMKQNLNKKFSPIKSVVQIPKSSSAASPTNRIHKSFDLRNKLTRKNYKSDNIVKNDSHDKHKSTKKDNIKITVDNTNNNEVKTETKDKKIDLVIKIIFEQKTDSKNECKNSCKVIDHHVENEQGQQNITNNVDLSFLDDFNIDEIVASLNDSERTQCDSNSHCIEKNDLTTEGEINKSIAITRSSNQLGFSKVDNTKEEEAGHLVKNSFGSYSTKDKKPITNDRTTTPKNTNVVEQEVKTICVEDDDDNVFDKKASKKLVGSSCTGSMIVKNAEYQSSTSTSILSTTEYNSKMFIQNQPTKTINIHANTTDSITATTDNILMSTEKQTPFLTQNIQKRKLMEVQSNDQIIDTIDLTIDEDIDLTNDNNGHDYKTSDNKPVSLTDKVSKYNFNQNTTENGLSNQTLFLNKCDNNHVTCQCKAKTVITTNSNINIVNTEFEENHNFCNKNQQMIGPNLINSDINTYQINDETKSTSQKICEKISKYLIKTNTKYNDEMNICDTGNISKHEQQSLNNDGDTKHGDITLNMAVDYGNVEIIDRRTPNTDNICDINNTCENKIGNILNNIDHVNAEFIEKRTTAMEVIRENKVINISNNFFYCKEEITGENTPSIAEVHENKVENNLNKTVDSEKSSPDKIAEDKLLVLPLDSIQQLVLQKESSLDINGNDETSLLLQKHSQLSFKLEKSDNEFESTEKVGKLECEEIKCDSKLDLDINENETNTDAASKDSTAYICETSSDKLINIDDSKHERNEKVEYEKSENHIDKETAVQKNRKTYLPISSEPDSDSNKSKTPTMKITDRSNSSENKKISVDGTVTVGKADRNNKPENEILNKSTKAVNRFPIDKFSNENIARELEECIPGLLHTRMPHSVKHMQSGKFSKIFLCENVKGYKYAIKVLRVSNDQTVDIQKTNMLTDIQRTIPRNSYKCIDIINSFSLNGFWCIIMEYFPWNLQQALEAKKKSFYIDAVQNMAAQLVSAVMMLNNHNIVHLDIKPNHILLNKSCNKLKLCGFDSARYIDCPISLLPNVGMANYRAPEIILGYRVNYKVDVWMTALVLYEMATNKKLFTGVFNNDILFQQMCTFGNIPHVMIENSVYSTKHFLGTNFKRITGYGGQFMSIITKFKFNNRFECLGATIHQAFTMDWNNGTPRQNLEDRYKLNSLINLLEQMLMLFPENRLPIEFVCVHPFISENYQT